MQARCPHCSNVFNTERAGIQFCSNCGQQINVPDPAGSAAPPPPPPPRGPGISAVERGPVPWEERSQRGLVAAFIETWKMVTTRTEAFWSRLRPDGSLGDGLLYGWMISAVNTVISLPLQLLSLRINREQLEQALASAKDLPPQVSGMFRQAIEFMLGKGLPLLFLGQLILYPVLLIVGAALVHLSCLIFGVAKNGFNATVRVVGYSQSPYIFSWLTVVIGLVPLVGSQMTTLVSLALTIYWMVLLIWGLARVQDSTTGRAVAAILVPVGLLCCCCVGGLFLSIAMAASQAGNMR